MHLTVRLSVFGLFALLFGLAPRRVLAVEARGMTIVTMHITRCLHYEFSRQAALLRTARATLPKSLSATLCSVEGQW